MIPLDGLIPALEHNSLTVNIPNSTAEKEDSEPINDPIGVLATAQIATLDFPIDRLKWYLS